MNSTKTCIIIGHPVAHSLSPAMHNAAYAALDLDYEYQARDYVDIEKAIHDIRSENICGVSVTIPHKESVLSFLDEIDPIAEKIGAVNTIVNESGKLVGYNTDLTGAMMALEEKTDLRGKRVAVIGCGGASRAIVFGLLENHCEVALFNRSIEKALKLAEETHTKAFALSDFPDKHAFDILINTTSLGMHPHETSSPLPPEKIGEGCIVFDAVYTPKDTLFLRDAQKRHCEIVYGYKMLLFQGMKQFELFTGKEAPSEVMEQVLLVSLF